MHYALISTFLKKLNDQKSSGLDSAEPGAKKNKTKQKKYTKFDCRSEARSCLNKDVT